MGLKAWLGDPLGLRALAKELAAERQAQREMLGQVLRVTQEQSQGVLRITEVLAQTADLLKTDGLPPEGRAHFSEADEYALWEEAQEARSGLNG